LEKQPSVGLGKSIEIPEAIRKGKEDAAKHLVSVALDENNSVTHDFLGKYGSSTVLLKKAPEGTGIIAGGPARVVCELAGIKNIHQQAECRSGNHSGIKPDQDS
jgi:small subunit ribosomal protein S5